MGVTTACSRLVPTKPLGGVGGVRSNAAPIPIALLMQADWTVVGPRSFRSRLTANGYHVYPSTDGL